MNTTTHLNLGIIPRLSGAFGGLTLLAALSLTPARLAAATIDYVGIDKTSGSFWIGTYGTDGYDLLALHRDGPAGNTGTYQGWNGTDGNVTSLPIYISSITVPGTTVWSGNGNVGRMQDPTQGGALVNTPAVLPQRGGGSITINRATGDPFALTVFVGVFSDGGFPNNAYTFTLSDGIGSAAGKTTVLPVGGQPGTPNMAYLKFMVGEGTDPLTLSFSADPINLAGLAFDPPLPPTPPTIVQAPSSGTCLENSAFRFSVTATGTEPLAYYWYTGTALLPGSTTNVLDFASLALTDAGTYTVVVSNAQGAVTSSPAMLAVETTLPDKIVRYQTAVRDEVFLVSSYPFDYGNANDAVGLNDGTLVGTTQFGQGPAGGANQALIVNGGGHVALGTTPDFTFPTGKGAIEAWVRAGWTTSPGYNPTLVANREGGSARYSLHMDGAAKNRLAFWNGANVSWTTIPAAGTNWHLLAVSFDTGSWTVYWDGQTMMTLPLPFGTGAGLPTQLGSANSATTTEGWVGGLDEVSFFSDVLTPDQVWAHYVAFIAGDPPVMDKQPQGGLFFVGNSLTLSAHATGAELTYQWYKNDAPVDQALTTQLEFASLTEGDAGSYYFVALNGAGSATSTVARVEVRVADFTRYQETVRAESSLISFYPFDDGTANDVISANQGSLSGTTSFAPGPGAAGDQALLLTGAGFVGFGMVPVFDFTDTTGTVEAWVRADWNPTAPPPYNPCLFAERDGTPTRWSIHLLQDKTTLAFWNGTTVSLAPIPPAGTAWHQCACVFDSGSWLVYWDGQAVATNSNPLGSGVSLPTQLGSSSGSTATEAWVGALDALAFYGDALTSSQVAKHYSAMIDPALHYSDQGGGMLKLWWPAGLTGFTLESTGTLPGTTWEPVDGVVDNSVVVPAFMGTRFYRLRR